MRLGAAARILAALAAAAVSSPSEAREPLTLRSAVETALGKNPSALQSREKVREADHTVALAFSQFLPNIAATGAASYRKDAAFNPFALFGAEPYNFYTVGLQFTQPIFAGGALFGSLDYAKSSKAIAGLDSEISDRNLTVNVIAAFYSILLNQRKAQTLRDNFRVQSELLKTTRQRQRNGRLQVLDVLQIRTQLALLEPQIAQADNQVKIAATQLAGLLGEQESSEISVAGDLEPVPWPKVEAKTRGAKYRILENEKLEEQLLQLDANRSVTLASSWPQLSAAGTWGRNAYVKTDLLSDDATTWAFGIQLTVPLFSGLSSLQQRRILSAQQRELELGRAQLLDSTSLAQVQTQKNIELSLSTIESSRKAYDLGAQALREAAKDYRFATIDYIQYLASQQSLLTAELNYDQAKYDYVSNLAQYFVSWGYPLGDLVDLLESK